MDVFNAFAFGTAGYLSIQAVPLLLTPRLIVSMLAADPRRMTDLEAYLSRSLGLALLLIALLCLLLTGALPLTTTLADSDINDEDKDGMMKNPYAYPTLVVTTTYHAGTAFYVYTQLMYRGSFAFGTGMVVSSALFCLGVWLMVFGSEKGRVSKTTGADKRTGNFPFENKESARAQKKDSKRKSVARNGSARA